MVEASINLSYQKFQEGLVGTTKRTIRKRIARRFTNWVFKDSPEYLEQPGIPFKTRYKIVDKLSKLNNLSGYNGFFIRELEKLISMLPPRRDGQAFKILDIGAGGGGLLRSIYKWSRKKQIPVELTGVDASHEFVVSTQFNLRQQGIPVEMHYGDACQLSDFKDNAFDIVLSSYVVHHIRSAGKVGMFLSEVERLAKYGWLIADFDRRYYGPSFVGVVGMLLSGSWILTSDGIKSAQRAYGTRDINFILDELAKEQKNTGMTCKAYPLLPYWTIKGIKANDT